MLQLKNNHIIITIDGPAASGKSTLARMIAKKFDYYYVCSGFLYRALSYLLLTQKNYTIDSLSGATPTDIAACLDQKRFMYSYSKEQNEQISFNSCDITLYLKDSVIDMAASIIGAHESARYYVTQLQHSIACGSNIVTDGRDVGSVTFPNARYKFFLTASLEVRVDRWLADQNRRGKNFTPEQAKVIISDRDSRDLHREIGRLLVPEGAIIVDNSNLDIDQTFNVMCSYLTIERT